VLAELVEHLSRVSAVIGSAIRLYVEPTGDACETDNWVDVTIDRGTIWAEITPRPARYGGAIPELIERRLELAGWVPITSGADPDPYDHETGFPVELAHLDAPNVLHGPIWRLVTEADVETFSEWTALVAHGVHLVISPDAQRWYFHAETEVLDAGPLHDPPYAPTTWVGDWHIDLGVLLSPSAWERAVWRPDTEAGAICCDLGLHQFHEPPCPPPARWQTNPVNEAQIRDQRLDHPSRIDRELDLRDDIP
jgi:hypothetical protein